MNKHQYNIFPEARPEDFSRLLDDIRQNGYDITQPVTLYDGNILDGWNRQRACDELGIKPAYTTFTGTNTDAIAFVMRTNKRRNLNSGQWACIAAEADELLAVIAKATEDERRAIQAASLRETNAQKAMRAAEVMDDVYDNKLSQTKRNEHANSTPTKAAELFNTNRTYVNQERKPQQPLCAQEVSFGGVSLRMRCKGRWNHLGGAGGHPPVGERKSACHSDLAEPRHGTPANPLTFRDFWKVQPAHFP